MNPAERLRRIGAVSPSGPLLSGCSGTGAVESPESGTGRRWFGYWS